MANYVTIHGSFNGFMETKAFICPGTVYVHTSFGTIFMDSQITIQTRNQSAHLLNDVKNIFASNTSQHLKKLGFKCTNLPTNYNLYFYFSAHEI